MSAYFAFHLNRSSHSHAEDASFGVLNRRVERNGHTETKHTTQVLSLDDSIVPEARSRVICIALLLVVSDDRVLEFLHHNGIPLVLKLNKAEDFTGLSATHDRDL